MQSLSAKKDDMRVEAKRARALLSMTAQDYDALVEFFMNTVTVDDSAIIGAYWPKGREIDTHLLIDACLEKGARVTLPVIQEGEKELKFARYMDGTEMTVGQFGVSHPVINDDTEWLEPDVFIVPMLAFDRRGYRLGYGGGYYDATLSAYKKNKEILAIGLGYAEQACLFNLPTEEHDIKMDWIITQQGAQSF